MKMSHFWPKKAINLVFCNDQKNSFILIAKVENEPFWPNSKAKTLVFCRKMTKMKFIHFDCRLKSDENEPFLAKK